jgi:RPA family protein
MNLENQQQPARRVFADELNDATQTVKHSDDDRAPVFSLLPTQSEANRVFVVGTLTEVEDVGSDDEYLRARIVGPTGTFFAYAGQYQPDAAAFMKSADAPSYVAVVSKIRTYETDNGDINVSLRPETMSEVDAADRDRWVVETAQQTLARIDGAERGEPIDGSDPAQYDDYPLEDVKEAAIEALEGVHEAQVQAQAESESEAEQEANA